MGSQWAPTRGARCSSIRSGSRGRTSCPSWRRSPRRRPRRGRPRRLAETAKRRKQMRATILQQRKKGQKARERGERHQKKQKKMEREPMRKEEMERKWKSRVAQFGELRRLTCCQ